MPTDDNILNYSSTLTKPTIANECLTLSETECQAYIILPKKGQKEAKSEEKNSYKISLELNFLSNTHLESFKNWKDWGSFEFLKF